MQAKFYNPETKIWSARQNESIFNPEVSVGDIIWNSLNKNASRCAQILADDDSRLTFSELRELSVRAAWNLESFGVKAGDVVAVAGRNNKEIAAVIFGCLFIGAPVHTLDPSFGKDDLAHMFDITKPKIVVCETSNVVHVEAALLNEGLGATTETFTFGDSVTSRLLKPVNTSAFSPLLISDCSETTAVILCSSGTTGNSKAVCMSHAQINSQILVAWGTVETDVCLVFSSLYWISGMATLIEATVTGATRILTENPFSADIHIGLIEKYKVTFSLAPPAHLAAILVSQALKKADLSSIRLFLAGGSMIPEDLRQEFENSLPNGIVRTCYGLTEVAIITSSISKHKPVSVGQLRAQAMVKIIDDDGNSLGPNQQGQIIIKVPYSFIEYLRDPEQTLETKDPKGWVYTGDLGYFDDDAFLFIVGRSKDIIKYRGYQISPAELEEFLQKETGIKQVCVIGIEDRRNGTDLPAAVFLDTGDNQMSVGEIKKIAEAKLPDYKQLRGGVYFVDKFPMTPSGKIMRKELKQFIERFYVSSMRKEKLI